MLYETMFRGYDAVLGRFHQVDPLTSASMQFSPYAFAFNNPVFYNAPAGAYPANTYVPQTWDPMAMGPGSGGDAVFEPLMQTFGPLHFGQHFYCAGSAHAWFRQYASVERNARVMSQSQFNSCYNIHTDADRGDVASRSFSPASESGEFAGAIQKFIGGSVSPNGQYLEIPL